jgi:ubiquinone/menaquinone biosynthesis C-methylase UbiE
LCEQFYFQQKNLKNKQLSKDNFSKQSDVYVKFRPNYPQELYDFLMPQVAKKELALDCGTGNGHAASILAGYFKKVFAIDISSNQLKNAVKKDNIEYIICPVEQTPFKNDSFDLITVATAVHWFQFDAFYNEMYRIGKDGCIFSCWAYSLLQTNEPGVNELLQSFYFETLKGYWDKERKLVEEEYKTLPFPFEEIENPGFSNRLEWSFEELEGYLNTWSAVQHYIQRNTTNPVSDLMRVIHTKFPPNLSLTVMVPVFMRVGMIHKK